MRAPAKRIVGGAAAVVLSLTTAALTARSAAADSTTFTDGGGHLTTVRVDNTYGPDDIRVKARVGDFSTGSHFSFWIDTDSENAGPEYRIKVYPNSEVLPIQSVESFAGTGTNLDCDYSAHADAGGSSYVTIRIPSDCLGSPDRIRVSVRANYAVPGPNVVDWGPGRKKFFDWVWNG